MANTARPITFFDLTIGGAPAGRVVFSLYTDLVPKTAENFRMLMLLLHLIASASEAH